MLRIVYISTSRQPIDRAPLSQILRVSRANNARCGVTGLLLSGGTRFLQALEGPDEAVETTYRRILADPRHYAAVVLRRQVVETRLFPDWTMGSQASSAAGGTGTIGTAIATLVAQIDDPMLRAEFEQFALRHAA